MDARTPQSGGWGADPTSTRGLSTSPEGVSTLGEYRLLRRIGEGGMSVVYLGYHLGLQRTFAVKVLADHLVGNHFVLQRFLQESQMSRKLSHPHIICGYEGGQDPITKRHFLVMEFIDGPTAHQRLEKEGCLPVREAVRIVLDIARALEYLHHQNFVHRDIKPDNILIAPDGSAKLADLGVVKQLRQEKDLTAFGGEVGTIYYMPWEQARNPNIVDRRSDLFALGATLYHLVTGQVPFPGDDETAIIAAKMNGEYVPITKVNPHLPVVLDTILERLLAFNPHHRFQTATDLIDTLTASGLLEWNGPTTPMTPRTTEPQSPPPTKADLQRPNADTPLEGDKQQTWVIRYRRGNGSWRKIRGKTDEVVQLLQNGLLPEEVYAAREPTKQYRRIRAYPEFRNVVPLTQTRKQRRVNPLRGQQGQHDPQRFQGITLASLFILLLSLTTAIVWWFTSKP